jgi:hypothetical protein
VNASEDAQAYDKSLPCYLWKCDAIVPFGFPYTVLCNAATCMFIFLFFEKSHAGGIEHEVAYLQNVQRRSRKLKTKYIVFFTDTFNVGLFSSTMAFTSNGALLLA